VIRDGTGKPSHERVRRASRGNPRPALLVGRLETFLTAPQVQEVVTARRRRLEQTDPFLTTPLNRSREKGTQSTGFPLGKRDLDRGGKIVGVFLEPEAKLLGSMNKKNIAIITVAKPGTETSRNVDRSLLRRMNRRINSKAQGLDGVREDDHLLEIRWCVEKGCLDAKLNSNELRIKGSGATKRSNLFGDPVTISKHAKGGHGLELTDRKGTVTADNCNAVTIRTGGKANKGVGKRKTTRYLLLRGRDSEIENNAARELVEETIARGALRINRRELLGELGHMQANVHNRRSHFIPLWRRNAPKRARVRLTNERPVKQRKRWVVGHEGSGANKAPINKPFKKQVNRGKTSNGLHRSTRRGAESTRNPQGSLTLHFAEGFKVALNASILVEPNTSPICSHREHARTIEQTLLPRRDATTGIAEHRHSLDLGQSLGGKVTDMLLKSKSPIEIETQIPPERFRGKGGVARVRGNTKVDSRVGVTMLPGKVEHFRLVVFKNKT